MPAPVQPLATPNQRVVEELLDLQIAAFIATFGANMRHALSGVLGRNPIAEAHNFPITLDLLTMVRLPALAVYRLSDSPRRQGKQAVNVATIQVQWWMDQTSAPRLREAWPTLRLAASVINATVDGRSLYDIAAGERVAVGSALEIAGIHRIEPNSMNIVYDFASNQEGQVFPVVSATFRVQHDEELGSMAYSVDDAHDTKGNTLVSEAIGLFGELNLVGSESGELGDDEQPLVAFQATPEGGA